MHHRYVIWPLFSTPLSTPTRDNIQIPALARQLSTALNQTSYLNTQEAAFAFLALGKLARQTANSTATATLTAGNTSPWNNVQWATEP